MVTAARTATFGAAGAQLNGLLATVELPAMPPVCRKDDEEPADEAQSVVG